MFYKVKEPFCFRFCTKYHSIRHKSIHATVVTKNILNKKIEKAQNYSDNVYLYKRQGFICKRKVFVTQEK